MTNDRNDPRHEDRESGLSRRDLLRRLGIGAVVAPIAAEIDLAAITRLTESENVTESAGPGPVAYTLNVNDQKRKVSAEPRETLLDVLRERLDLTGTKPICDRGACGGCTVLLDGRPVNSCLLLALDARGREVRTVEGLERGGVLDSVQEAFIEKDALMCGFCTPGFLMCARSLLDRNSSPSPEEVRQALSGNLCRCGTYPHVFDAVRSAGGRAKPRKSAKPGNRES